MSNELRPIDIELIKSLRVQKKYDEADRLMVAWRKNNELQRKQDKLEINREDRAKRKVYGVCATFGCNNPPVVGVRGKLLTTCQKCTDRAKRSSKAHYSRIVGGSQ